MKQARRKELKTNELSIYLQQIQEAVVRHSNYIIGGIVVVGLVVYFGAKYIRRSQGVDIDLVYKELPPE